MVGELFASDVKAIAAPLAGTFNWLLGESSDDASQFSHLLNSESFSAFVITKTFVNLKTAIGDGQTFWLFSGLSIVGTVFVFFLVPETKGKSLNEIQKMLAGEKETNESSEEKE